MDFGFAEVVLCAEPTKIALFVMAFPYSDALFIQACTASFQEGY